MDEIRKYMRQISRMAHSFTSKALKNIDLSPSEIQVLRIVTHHKQMSQKSLVEHLGVDKAAVARLINSMEEKGYITRRADASDKRVKLVYPTKAAEAVKKELIATETSFYSWLFHDIPQQDLEIFQSILEKIYTKASRQREQGFEKLLEVGKECS